MERAQPNRRPTRPNKPPGYLAEYQTSLASLLPDAIPAIPQPSELHANPQPSELPGEANKIILTGKALS